jgi:hypothetical protein
MMARRFAALIGGAFMAAAPLSSGAQVRKLRVVSTDSVPVMYAYVTIEGGTGLISDEKGEISLGAGKRKTVTLNVRRIGYQPWFGKLDLPDTAATLTVMLPRLAQALGEVRVTGRASAGPGLQPFYDRWLMRQKGVLSASFIGPEEIEFRHPDKITNMLSGLNGVSFRRTDLGDLVAFGYNNQCQMAVLFDGVRQCPGRGCKCDDCGGNSVGIMSRGGSPRDTARLSEMTAVPIDRLIDANDVAAIEVYTRGANMPVSLQVSDAACGVIAIWTGSRIR